jgi:bidirectional [NiFe] hydrogenase diaphorase subunit
MMAYLSKEMKVPPSRIYGVVTFYHFFSLKPKGEHTCVVCTGTACHVKGSLKVLNQIEEEFTVKAGGMTADGKLGVQTARCLGCCSLGPVAVFDNDIVPKAEPEKLVALIHEKAGI